MAYVQTFAEALWDRLLVAGDAENPLQVLHQQVSLVDLTNDQLDALDKFTRSLSDVKQQ